MTSPTCETRNSPIVTLPIEFLAEKARERTTAEDSTFGERAAATAVWTAMKIKTKLGMSLRKKKRKTTRKILPTTKRGDLLLIFPILGALGSLIGGAAAVNACKVAGRQLEELQHYNRTMEDHELHLAPYKRGSGVTRRTRKKNRGRKRLRSLELPLFGLTTNE
ncbi:hypothetical protein P5V15_001177 [Pogonomyrmex californicus]